MQTECIAANYCVITSYSLVYIYSSLQNVQMFAAPGECWSKSAEAAASLRASDSQGAGKAHDEASRTASLDLRCDAVDCRTLCLD